MVLVALLAPVGLACLVFVGVEEGLVEASVLKLGALAGLWVDQVWRLVGLFERPSLDAFILLEND